MRVRASSSPLRELPLPYYGCTENLAGIHGQLNNYFLSSYKTKRDLSKLTALCDIDLFSLNAALNSNLNSGNQVPNRYPVNNILQTRLGDEGLT